MFARIFLAGTALVALTSALVVPRQDAGWPHAPFRTSGRNIVNNQGDTVVYAGINWSGHGEAMIPEGLQYQSIETIVSRVKSLGMNVIRLTYAIEMIDDIIDDNPNSTLRNSFINALGTGNGTSVVQDILRNNPQFTEETTRIEVFDAVAAECLKQQIYIHQDNHMSKGAWCCNADDGNAWFGDTYFNIENWKRGIAWMADHGKTWPALVSVALRNELRQPIEASPARSRYGWADWYANVIDAANGVNAANPDPLIFYSGLNYDTDLGNVTAGLPLNDRGDVFDIESYSYADKIVFELHNYNNGLSDSNCANFNMYSQGYNAMDESSTTTAKNIAPVLMTEFGFSQTETESQRPYAQCIKDYVTSQRGGWMQWVISGSYYIRQGQQDYDETWAVMNHDWSDWRSRIVVDQYLMPFVRDTLEM